MVDLPEDDVSTIRRLQDGDGSTFHEINEAGNEYDPTREVPFGETNLMQSPTTEAPSASRTDEVPYNNLRVYIAADKFGIDPLKKLARDRQASWLKGSSVKEVFTQVVKSILQSLPPHETQLRDIIAHVISENVQSFIMQKSLLNLLEEFGSLAIIVLEKVVEYSMSAGGVPNARISRLHANLMTTCF